MSLQECSWRCTSTGCIILTKFPCGGILIIMQCDACSLRHTSHDAFRGYIKMENILTKKAVGGIGVDSRGHI